MPRKDAADAARAAVVTRVASRDGTEIAYATSGKGPPLVLVHGTTADRGRWTPLLPYLESHVTVHAVDRRGRGASGDGPAYDVGREFEDVAAVVDDVAAAADASVDLLGHSFGGVCALGAAAATANVGRLVLYEPPFRDVRQAAPDVLARLQELLADGRPEAVLETFLREVVRMPDEELAVYRTLPPWPARIAAAGTIPRELATEVDAALPLERVARVAAPTLLLAGGDSPPAMRADTEALAGALPDARVVVLEGQQHIAIDLVPELFARHVLDFLRPASS